MTAYDERTALIVVDVQNDFADPAGSLYVPGGEKVLPVVNEEIRRARAAGALVVYTKDWHPESTPHFEKYGGLWPVHCVQGTWGAELHPELAVEGPAVPVGTEQRDGYSGFESTGTGSAGELEERLLGRGVARVVVVGLATDYCVKATAIDAAARGFETTALREAMRAVNIEPGDDERAFEQMRARGVTVE